MSPRRLSPLIVALATALLALAASGCGASKAVKQTVDPQQAKAAVVSAADTAATVPGYRLQATFSLNLGTTSVTANLSGLINRTTNSGQLTTDETVAGHALSLKERYGGGTYYIAASGIPDVSRLTSKPWLKFDSGKELSALGLGGLPTQSPDPSQFVKYLKAAGDQVKKLGTATIRGVPTTHYEATVDLANYVKVVPAADRAKAQHAIKLLESTIQTHSIAMQVWIDSHHYVRRMRFGFTECVQNQHFKLNLSMDLFDYGSQPKVTLPPPSQAYDLTSLIKSEAGNIKLGCTPST